jgi:hypothetical protein
VDMYGLNVIGRIQDHQELVRIVSLRYGMYQKMSDDNKIEEDGREQESPPIFPDIKCPICGHKPMAPIDPNVRKSTLILLFPSQPPLYWDSYVFRCERCWNIQSFIKTLGDK